MEINMENLTLLGKILNVVFSVEIAVLIGYEINVAMDIYKYWKEDSEEIEDYEK